MISSGFIPNSLKIKLLDIFYSNTNFKPHWNTMSAVDVGEGDAALEAASTAVVTADSCFRD